MWLEGYILDVPVAGVGLPNIGPVTTRLLQKFARRELSSAYQVHRDTYYHWDSVSYKNTNKKVHKLNELNLIKVQKKDNTKHRAIYYKVTPLGIFYMFYKDEVFDLNVVDLFKNYETDKLLTYLLYPYFERGTLLSIRSSVIQGTIKTFLTSSCKIIAQFAEDIKYSEKFPGKKSVLHLKNNYEQQIHESNFSQIRNFLLFDLEAELNKMIFSWIVRSQQPLPIRDWRADLQNDLLVLGKDKKFIETLKNISLRYENASSEFLKIASQILP